MKQEIKLRYFNEGLQIGLVSWREAYLLKGGIRPLLIETYKGRIVYREKGSGQRISYNRLKGGLRKTKKVFLVEVPDWLHDLSPKKQNPHQTKA